MTRHPLEILKSLPDEEMVAVVEYVFGLLQKTIVSGVIKSIDKVE